LIKVPLRSVNFNVKVQKKIRKTWKVNMLLRKGHDFSSRVLHRSEINLFSEPSHVINQRSQNLVQIAKI
jgi:hypothetical protein